MIKLSEMKAIVASLDEQGFSPLVEEVLAPWAHDAGSNRIIRVSSNAVFSFQCDGQDFILRFVGVGERAYEAVQAEMEFLDFLAGRGLNVNQPLPSLAGRVVETVQTSLGGFHAVVLSVLQGKMYELEELPAEMLVAWGRALGNLHNAAQGFDGAARPSWQSHLAWAGQALPESEETARQVLVLLKARLAQYPIHAGNFGIIHYDFELDNLFWNGDQPGMIDFDDSAVYWLAADIGYAMRDLFDDRPSRVNLDDPAFRAFVRGYRSVRQIRDEELQRIPTLVLLLNLLKYTELRRIVVEGVTPDEPDWVKGIRQRLSGILEKYREEFEQALAQ